jgi:hypothetical protein
MNSFDKCENGTKSAPLSLLAALVPGRLSRKLVRCPTSGPTSLSGRADRR